MATATMPSTVREERVTAKLTGWAMFAGIVLVVAGGFNLVNGYTALEHSGYYTNQVVYHNMTFWGWAFLIWGALQLIAGSLVFTHHAWGTYLGIFVAATAAILWFFMIFAAPWAALLGVTISLLVLYGLTAGARPDEY